MSWQPIETAPKDRRILLVCMKANKKMKHKEGVIHADKFDHRIGAFGSFNRVFFPATHWMECPELPNSQNQSPANSV